MLLLSRLNRRVGSSVFVVGLGTSVLLSTGCDEKKPTSDAGTNSPTNALSRVGGVVARYDGKPVVLLTSRKSDRLIVAIDFAGTKALDKSVSLEDRRVYVLDHVLALYASGPGVKEKAGQSVRILALSVPNRDDYARGDFRSMDELAIVDAVHESLIDRNKSASERAGKTEWRPALIK